ncbi:hypothetical protein, partial [Escherichia coli]|uniref:hypothetical protein n=1 Tax=Escherichia coli TaxID=562 RepID=UPI003FD1CF0E
ASECREQPGVKQRRYSKPTLIAESETTFQIMRENQQSCKDFRQQIVCKCNKLLIETANSWGI